MKKGISLIVLVITIIVMIILAASVVITLSNTEVIKRASEAVDATNQGQVQNLATLIWADAYMNDKRDGDLRDVVIEELRKQGVTEDKWKISVTDTGVTIQPKPSKITFTIDGVQYQADKEMTWGSWVESEYNTANLMGGTYGKDHSLGVIWVRGTGIFPVPDAEEASNGVTPVVCYYAEDGLHAAFGVDNINENMAYLLLPDPLID